MRDLQIKAMTADLVAAGLIQEDQAEAAHEALRKHWTDKIAVIWCDDDVSGRAEERDMVISQKTAHEILEGILNRHDASIGVNWDVIDVWLEDEDAQKESEELIKIQNTKTEDLPLLINEVETEAAQEWLKERIQKGE